MCDGTDSTPRFEAGVAYAYMRSTLRFDGRSDFDIHQQAVVGSFGYRLSDRMTAELSAGAVLGGRLEGEGRGYDILPGPLFSVSGAYRVFGQPSSGPFVAATLSIGASFAHTRADAGGSREHLSAGDARLGGLFGWMLFHRFAPYAAARVFGGPVSWRELGADRSGTDTHRYTLGVGASFAPATWFALRVEAMALGEQTLSGGATLVF